VKVCSSDSLDALLQLLKRETASSVGREHFEDSDDDSDFNLFYGAVNVMMELSLIAGAAMTPYFSMLLEVLVSYMTPNFIQEYQLLSIGLIAELIIESLPEAVVPFAAGILELAFMAMKGTEPSLVRNGSYCARALTKFCPEQVSPYVNDLLAQLAILFNHEDVNVVDNAVACLAQVVLSFSESVPLSEVLPHILSKLPVKGDIECCRCIYALTKELVRANPPGADTYFPQILSVSIRQAEHESFDGCMGRKHCTATIEALLTHISAEQWQGLVNAILSETTDEDKRNRIQAYVNTIGK